MKKYILANNNGQQTELLGLDTIETIKKIAKGPEMNNSKFSFTSLRLFDKKINLKQPLLASDVLFLFSILLSCVFLYI